MSDSNSQTKASSLSTVRVSKDSLENAALSASNLIEDIEIFQRAKEKMGHIDDKMLLWCLKGTVLLDVPVFSYQSALIDELEDRLFPEYDGDKVKLEDFGWSTPDGLIIYSDVFCTCECHRTKGLLHDVPCCAKCPYCFRHFKPKFYNGHPETCSRNPTTQAESGFPSQDVPDHSQASQSESESTLVTVDEAAVRRAAFHVCAHIVELAQTSPDELFSPSIDEVAEIIATELSVHQPDVKAVDVVQLLREIRSLLFVAQPTEQVKAFIARINAVEDAAAVQVDEVAKSLEELRVMFPNTWIFVADRATWTQGCESPTRSAVIEIERKENAFFGTTLSEAIKRVRVSKEQDNAKS